MKPTVIRCSKCGYESNIISDTCIKCGAALEKVCGHCGAPNSVEKNYCDQCGKLMALKPPPETEEANTQPAAPEPSSGPKIEFESIDQTVQSRDDSYRKKLSDNRPNPPGSEPFASKKAEVEKYREDIKNFSEKKEAEKKSEEARKTQAAKQLVSAGISFRKRILAGLIFLAVLLAAGYVFFVPYAPRFKLTLTAKKYLSSLKNADYKNAYDYLSNNSKDSCPFTEYLKYNEAYYSRNPVWEFRNLRVFTMNDKGAVIKYELKEGTGPWKDDYLSFVSEHGRWTRPYVWNLFQPIDEAISRGDYSQALFLSQRLYLTDPMDPRTSGYLCNTEYLMGLYDKAVESCRRTIEAGQVYPVGFSDEEIFWYKFYYADSLRFLSRTEEALAAYEELSSYKDLSIKNKCPLMMSLADAKVRKRDYEGAIQDMSAAVNVCVYGVNRVEAQKRWKYLSGEASADAVSVAQRSRISADSPALLEMRTLQLNSALAAGGKKKEKIRDDWRASHLEGPEYLVSLVQEKTDLKTGKKEESEIYRLKVNLWTGSVKMQEKDK